MLQDCKLQPSEPLLHGIMHFSVALLQSVSCVEAADNALLTGVLLANMLLMRLLQRG